jgi:hypothetical protein
VTGRRALLAVPLLAARPALALPAELRFRVVREGSQIGTHRVFVAETGGGLTARTEVDIAVRMMGITVFRLTHRFTEDWAGERLRSAVSRHDRNGTVTEMRAEAVGDAIQVQGGAGRHRLPAEAAPLTWWDSRRFVRPLFDNATGEPLTRRFARSPLPGGGTLWRATAGEDSEGTYAADGTWTGWRTRAEDGSIVTYERA